MHINRSRGFTLIELLVVIAIIGVLSSVVLASLNTARNKGTDAATKANLSAAMPEAELYYDTNGNYDNVCLSTSANNIFDSAQAAANAQGSSVTAGRDADGSSTVVSCNDVASGGWAIQAPLKAGGFFCVDSTGLATTTAVDRIAATSDVTCGS
jgi:prepilin-type N-terminal cleavage/methylation domain-containing protein